MNRVEKILEIIQKNYNTFKGTNEAELHSSVEIAELMEQTALEFSKWKDEEMKYTLQRDGLYYEQLRISGGKTREQIFNEWKNQTT